MASSYYPYRSTCQVMLPIPAMLGSDGFEVLVHNGGKYLAVTTKGCID